MHAEDRIEQLETEVAELREQLAQALARIHELEGQQSKNSRNSSKPPSSDGLTHQTRSQQKASGQKSGGQVGYAGHHLKLVQTPDVVRRYRPSRCAQCGTGVKALAVYLHQYQLLPLERTVELLEDLCGSRLSEGTLTSWEQEAARRLEPTMERLAEAVACSSLQHADETGIRIGGKLHWLHVNSTRFLTHLAWHKRLGRAALEAIGIWPRFRGGAMHSAAQQWQERGAHGLPLAERDEWVAQYFALLSNGYAAQPSSLASASATPKRGRPKQSAAKNLLDDLLRRAEQVLAFLDDLSLPFTNNQPFPIGWNVQGVT